MEEHRKEGRSQVKKEWEKWKSQMLR